MPNRSLEGKVKNKALLFTGFLVAFGAMAFYFRAGNEAPSFSEYRAKPKGLEKSPSERAKESFPKTRKLASKAPSKDSENVIDRSPAQRSDFSSDTPEAQERARKFLELQRSRRAKKETKKRDFDFLNSMGEGHNLMPDLQAIPASEGDIPGAQLVSGHYIVSGRPGAQALPVVKTERGTYAVFTGVLKIMLDKSVDPYTAASSYGGELNEVYEHINAVYLKYYDYDEALKAYKNIKNRAEVKSADLEILEHGRQPR